MADKPNILVIMADRLAPQALPFHGNTACKAPNLARLAERSVVFDAAYCNYPLSGPSRASMASGRLTPGIGMWDEACDLPSGQPTIAHWMRHCGYRTVLAGGMHVTGSDPDHGFHERVVADAHPPGSDRVADWSAGPALVPSATGMSGVVEAGPVARTLQEDYDEEVARRAVQSLHDLARRGEGADPWFQLVSFTSPHTPFVADRRYWDRYDPEEIDAPRVGAVPFEDLDHASRALYFTHGRHRHDVTAEDVRNARHGYYAMISSIDDRVGELLDALEASGQAGDTVVVFCADHGEMLGERGMWFTQSFHEWSARVPLLVSAPARFAPRRVAEPVSLVDLLPTLVELGGGTVDLPHDGASLVPALEGGPGRNLAICDYSGTGPCVPMRMVRKGRYKSIYTHGHPDILYDVEADPDELVDLAADPDHAWTLAALHSVCFEGWDPARIDARIRESQRMRLFLKRTPGPAPDRTRIARIDDEARCVRRGTGEVDGTKPARRLPCVAEIAPHHPALDPAEVDAILRGRIALPDGPK